MNPSAGRTLGATHLGDGRWRFLVWAPSSEAVQVELWGSSGTREIPMDPAPRGYHTVTVDDLDAGSLYRFRLEGGPELPDPASRYQPEGVHGPSSLVDLSAWEWDNGDWTGLPLEDFVVYELHVGTFTAEGTFEAAMQHLPELKELGVAAVELMPIAQFPGTRNWGYDGVFPFAAQNSYGGPDGLRRLVGRCHALGLAVVLDVVYNHLGPEGNYLREFGPYFTDRYRTPWGDGVNFDGRGSDEVRRFFIESALQWLDDFRVDALRIDAIHGILDTSARPFLQQLAEAVDARAGRLGRRLHPIVESDLGDVRVIRPRELGGFGMASQWADDFHHALHALLSGERTGYYADFGSIDHLAAAYTQGFVYTGQYSQYRGRSHGSSTAGIPARRFMVCSQNHDQVGNRVRGERLAALVRFERLKVAAGAVLLSPFVPLLFMGEEYGEEAPFLYFVSHSDPELAEAVRRGRAEEFASFGWSGRPPDPQDEQTFLRSKLNRELRHDGRHHTLWRLYRELLLLRRDRPSLAGPSKAETSAIADELAGTLLVLRSSKQEECLIMFNFGEEPAEVDVPFLGPPWRRVLDSADARWDGPGGLAPDEVDTEKDGTVVLRPSGFVVYVRGRTQGGRSRERKGATSSPEGPTK